MLAANRLFVCPEVSECKDIHARRTRPPLKQDLVGDLFACCFDPRRVACLGLSLLLVFLAGARSISAYQACPPCFLLTLCFAAGFALIDRKEGGKRHVGSSVLFFFVRLQCDRAACPARTGPYVDAASSSSSIMLRSLPLTLLSAAQDGRAGSRPQRHLAGLLPRHKALLAWQVCLDIAVPVRSHNGTSKVQAHLRCRRLLRVHAQSAKL